MKGQGLVVAVGCVVWPVLLLIAVGSWRFVRGQGWNYSRFGWSIAAADGRESMARDYLATRDVTGMTLEQLRADLGDETYFREGWSYIVGEYVPVVTAESPIPAYYRRSGLGLSFSRRGVLKGLNPGWNGDGPVASFDADVWKATPQFAREPMARDLLEREAQLLGTSRQELRQLLGEPDKGEIVVEYRVGDAYLEVHLGLDERIVHACVTQGS